MALPTEIPRSFRLYVTHVDGEGHFLKISGQLDQQASLMIESLFETARENLEKGVGAASPGSIHEGVICAAKYKDGTYYRAKIINMTNIATGLVGVHFIDFGNKDIISLSTIRFLDKYDPMFLQLRGQATDYYLARVINPSGRWEEPILMKLQSLLCYSEYPVALEVQTQTLPLISIQFKGNDLSTHLVSIRFGMAIPIAKQEILLLQVSENQHAPNWQSNFLNEAPAFSEHVPFLLNQTFPANPASAMRLQQNVAFPYNGSIPATPALINKRLLNNKVPRTSVNLKGPIRQPQQAPRADGLVLSTPPPATTTPPFPDAKPTSPKKFITYKSKPLEVNSQHQVYVSYAEEGPELFAVQLASEATKLQDMMDDINRRPHSSLVEPPMIGSVCLGRMSGDRIICRAIVMNLSGSQCKLFFVDFGDTEMVSYYDIFDIPEEYVKINVLAMRFCLSGVKKLEKGPHLNEAFKDLASGNVFTLKVVPPEGPPLIQYGELYLRNENILDLLTEKLKNKLQFKWLGILPTGAKHSVLVSYVDSCIKFYIQLSDRIDELNAVMESVKAHCENSSSPGELAVGTPCCARFPDDGNWYRARVRDTRRGKVVVAYVDYGNEQEVEASELRTITPELLRLPAVAMKCALKGFENRPVETKTSNQLEMLALEKTLMCHVFGVLSSDTMLVTLVDDSVVPPLDIARKMNQLSQPRSEREVKASTPIRKESGDSFSSPEGSAGGEAVSDEGRKRSFRRERSFKDERRVRDGDDQRPFQPSSPEGSVPEERRPAFRREKSLKESRRPGASRDSDDDFPHRGGSLRSRDKESGFERAGAGRDSDRFSGRPDRPGRNDRFERRGGGAGAGRPREERDDLEDQQQQPRHHNRDRRKPREGERLPEGAAPAARGRRAAPGEPPAARASVQDRLRRDTRFNQYEEREQRRSDDWGNRTGAGAVGARPERRDTRGERAPRREQPIKDRSDFGNRDRNDFGNRDRNEFGNRDKNEFGNRDKNEFGNRGPSGARGNLTPRERADKSFEDDKSFRSQGGGDKAGRAPFQPRGKFTQGQHKEILDPVPLDTPFEDPAVELGAQHEVSVTWIISPESFYTQILSLQPKFLEMMHKIPELYKGVRAHAGAVPVGASVLARYPVDGVLYRATVLSVQPFSKLIVRYVDFGNKQLVDAADIWQLDRQLMALPRMAVHCALLGVAPAHGEWKADAEIDLCFNAPRYQCVFQELAEEQHRVVLWNDGVSVADTLVGKQLAAAAHNHSEVTLKDEPIDMTIIVGQQILCRVTHVERHDLFSVQLDLEKAARLEETIAAYDLTKLKAPAAELVAAGTHCTVRHEGRVRRAVLRDASDPARVTALLADLGTEITTDLHNVMILPGELSVYYYQALQCTPHNYSPDSRHLLALDQLREKLTNNKFILYVNDVDGITLVGTLYEVSTGEKVQIFSPDEGAHEAVVPLCARAALNYSFGRAYVSHAASLAELYLQRASDGDRLALLLDDLYNFYQEGSPEPLISFEAETLCAANSADGNWYRGTVLAADGDQVKVHFTDYGNSETVAKESLRKLDSKFHEPCSLALVASLGLEALREEALAKLVEWTAEKEVQVTLSFGTDGWLASLHLDGVDLSMKLVEEQLAAPQSAAAAGAAGEEPAAVPEGCTQMYISHIDTPGHFWLQALDSVDRIEEVQAELRAHADSYAELQARELGALCAAKYLADEQWYRAEILDADSDITTVRFVDYGNTDVLDNRPGLLKALPDRLREAERYAIKTGVNAVPTGTGEWSEAATDHFTELAGDLSAPVHVSIVLRDVTTYVAVFVGGVDLVAALVARGHAARAEAPDGAGDLPSCFASHVNSPSEFWIQLESAAAELQAMEAALADADSFPELGARAEGLLCAARYPEDGAWYRAQVIVDGSEGTEVLFMDYGNASIVTDLRSLPDDLQAKPALSRKCALQKPRDIKSWSRRSEVAFNELAAEGATVFTVQFVASGDISIVELYSEGASVTERLVALCEGRPPAQRPPPLGRDLHDDAKLCYVQSLDEFYVHLEGSLGEVDRVTEELGAGADLEPISELKVGSVCAAFWSEDEQWYRAKVLEFCDVGYHVQFLDYGNKAKCEEFRQLPAELAALEPLAKCCRLAADPALHGIGRNKLDELSLEDVTFRIEYLDSTKEPTLVKVLVNGTDLVTMLTVDTPADTNLGQSNISIQETVPSIPGEVSLKSKLGETKLDAELPNECIQETIEERAEIVESAVETPNDAESAVEKTKDVESVVDTPKDVDSSVETSKDVDSVVETPKDVDSSVETPKDVDRSVDTSKDVDSIVETPKDVDSSVETPKDVDSSIDTPKYVDSVVETPKDVESIVETPKDVDRSVDTSKDVDSIVETPKDVDSSVETPKDVDSSIDTPKYVDSVVETPKDVESIVETPKDVDSSVETPKDVDSVVETPKDVDSVVETPTDVKSEHGDLKDTSELEKDDEFDDAEDDLEILNSSQPDLDGSMDSTDTVIENSSFEAQADSPAEEVSLDEGIKTETCSTPERDGSSDTLQREASDDTIQPSAGEQSRDPTNTDTGYTSGSDRDKSPNNDAGTPKNEQSPEKKAPENVDAKQGGVQIEVQTENVSNVLPEKEMAKDCK